MSHCGVSYEAKQDKKVLLQVRVSTHENFVRYGDAVTAGVHVFRT